MGRYSRRYDRNRRGQAGQSLVEFAITLPVMIVMFMVIAEGSWFFRHALILINDTRELSRYAAKAVPFENVEKYSNSLFGLDDFENDYQARFSYVKVKDLQASVYFSRTIGLTETYQYPAINLAGLEANQAVVEAIFRDSNWNAGQTDVGFEVVVADTALRVKPLTGFFGVKPYMIRSRSEFRVLRSRSIKDGP